VVIVEGAGMINPKAVTAPLVGDLSILVVDDDEGFCDIIADLLEVSNFKVFRAYSAVEAVDIVGRKKPDLILTDVMMPEIDGLTLVNTIAKDPKRSATPIIVMSADTQTANINAAWLNGANAFISKPFLIEELTETIAHILGQDDM
jgi:CheY-like chemotaxis protein